MQLAVLNPNLTLTPTLTPGLRTLILFEGGGKELTLGLRAFTLGLKAPILCERATHSFKRANLGLRALILCKGGLRELALVLILSKEAIPRSEKLSQF